MKNTYKEELARIYLKFYFALFYIFVFIYIIFTAIFFYKIIFESNHIGINPLKFIYIFICIAIFYSANLFIVNTRRNSIFMLLICIISISGIYFINKYDILVEYHEWIQRGMPSRPWE